MNELALFAGVGGGLLASRLLGWRTVCAVEIEPRCIETLELRQNEGSLEPFPIWSDICSFDGKPWHNKVGIITGGFPCQPFSTAAHNDGSLNRAIDLWPEMRRIIGEVQPPLVFGENVSDRAIIKACEDCERGGFHAVPFALQLKDLGGVQRNRYWFLAYADVCRQYFSSFNVQAPSLPELSPVLAWAGDEAREFLASAVQKSGENEKSNRETKKELGKSRLLVASVPSEPTKSDRSENRETTGNNAGALGVADGLAYGMDRLDTIGNGQSGPMAAAAFLYLVNHIKGELNGKENQSGS